MQGGEGSKPPSPFAYTELFEERLPQYLAMGMTYEQYYHGHCSLTVAYRKAYKIKQDEINYIAWLNGLYIYEAIGDNAPLFHMFAKNPKPLPYSDKPYGEEDTVEETKTKEEQQMQNGINFMTAAMVKINKTIKGEQENG